MGCEARGYPIPTLTWHFKSAYTGQTVQLPGMTPRPLKSHFIISHNPMATWWAQKISWNWQLKLPEVAETNSRLPNPIRRKWLSPGEWNDGLLWDSFWDSQPGRLGHINQLLWTVSHRRWPDDSAASSRRTRALYGDFMAPDPQAASWWHRHLHLYSGQHQRHRQGVGWCQCQSGQPSFPSPSSSFSSSSSRISFDPSWLE